MDLKGLKKRALENVAINKRTSVLLAVIFVMILGLVYSFVSFVIHTGAIRAQYKSPKTKQEQKTMTPIEYKESLIIGIENKLNKTEKKVDNFSKMISVQIEQSFKKENKLISDKVKNEAIRVSVSRLRLQALIEKTNKRIDLIAKKQNELIPAINKLNNKIQSTSQKLNMIKSSTRKNNGFLPPFPKTINVKNRSEQSNFLLPPPTTQIIKVTSNKEAKKQTVEKFEFSLEDNKGIDSFIKNRKKNRKKKNKKKLNNTVDMLTSFTSAYMITGAYAPVFGTSALGSVPVILESEGDLMLPNEYRGDIDKCFLIGGAVGDPSDNRVLIKIKQVECVFNDRKRQLYGNVNGWVYDKTGAAGVKGKFISKTGRYIWRMIAAGLLQGIGQGVLNKTASSSSGTTIVTNPASPASAVTQGVGQGVDNAFQKLANFYLKLAEKTVPALEAKGGQKVTVVFQGESQLQIKKLNAADLPFLNDKY